MRRRQQPVTMATLSLIWVNRFSPSNVILKWVSMATDTATTVKLLMGRQLFTIQGPNSKFSDSLPNFYTLINWRLEKSCVCCVVSMVKIPGVNSIKPQQTFQRECEMSKSLRLPFEKNWKTTKITLFCYLCRLILTFDTIYNHLKNSWLISITWKQW